MRISAMFHSLRFFPSFILPPGILLKLCLQAVQKDLRGEAREKSTSGGVLTQYVGARRLSATKHMSLFQQPAMAIGCDVAAASPSSLRRPWDRRARKPACVWLGRLHAE